MSKFLSLFVSLLLVYYGFTQDANYWSSAYGPGGFFVPGATIAKNGDSGVLFYNPALLAYNTKNASNISGSVYNYNLLSIKNGTGEGLDLRHQFTNIMPVIASNTIYLKLKKPITFAYAILYTPVFQFNASQRRDEQINVLSDTYSPGKEFYIGQYVHSNTINETSAIFSFGKSVNKKLAIGFSGMFTNRRQLFSHNITARALINDNSTLFQKLVTVSEYYVVNSRNYNLQFKAGLSYSFNDKNHLGIMLTLPTLKIFGKSDILAEYAINNLRISNTEIFLLGSTRQTKLTSSYKRPLSIAAGYTHYYKGGEIYIASEFFNKVKPYSLVQPRDEAFIRPDTGTVKEFSASEISFKDAGKSILNFSIGISFPLKNEVKGFISARTDFTYSNKELFENNNGFSASSINYDLYHLQAGANIKKRKFNLKAGILLSYGRNKSLEQLVNFDDPNEMNFLEGNKDNTPASKFSAGFMLAYVHNF
ncbi:hypothetical protein [Sediminibacterium sp.]|uniref:hypothetical protein n=1 Tax=Sediminibacterium sp. TaxID=1917865 RepID=UPI003F6F26EB